MVLEYQNLARQLVVKIFAFYEQNNLYPFDSKPIEMKFASLERVDFLDVWQVKFF